ncbi:MAG: menaquinol oxidoreductase [Deltaproteobacteria bacterium]|nr:menaquinol oxidoreductase [Deltaproteobacteria bacterium]
MRVLVSLIAVLALAFIAYLGVGIGHADTLFGVVIPYLALAIFLFGIIYRVVTWARVPVPFRIPTTCGQQKCLEWIKPSRFENPYNNFGVIIRVAMEVLFFRSLFRNVKSEIKQGKVVYGHTKWLWLAGLAFHYSFLVIIIRHLRFFVEPVPIFVKWAESLDGFFQVGIPILMLTDVVILAALTYLFLRRVLIPQLRYISLPADYFPLFLIGAIATTGILLRYFFKTDLIGIKELALGLVSLKPVVPKGIHWLFFMHFFLVCCLFTYFPFSKLLHMAGIFMSPTRNLANNNRAVRHINPWNPKVEVHTYQEYEDEFREKMVAAGIPVEKQPEPQGQGTKE